MFKSKTNQNSSKDQNEKFKDLLVNDLPDAIAIITQDLNQYLFTNNSYSSLTGPISNSDIKSHLDDFSIHKDALNKYKPEKLQTLLDFVRYAINHADFKAGKKLSCIFEYKSKAKNWQILVFEVKVFSKAWDNTPAVSIILHDMTEHYTATDLKIGIIQKGVVSHEFRTPLNGMLGAVDVMKRRINDAELLSYLNVIRNSGMLLMSLINASLDLIQIQNDRLRLYPTKFNLVKQLENTMDLFKYHCGNKGLFLKTEISDLTPKFVDTDSHRFTQILINLIGNAIKFTFEGGITVSAKPSADKKYVEIAVKDTGIGLQEEDKEKIIKGLGETLPGRYWMGLGLSISEDLARLLGGDEQKKGISLESEYRKGATFSFWMKTKLIENSDENVESADENEDEDEDEEGNNVDQIMGQHTMEKNPAKF